MRQRHSAELVWPLGSDLSNTNRAAAAVTSPQRTFAHVPRQRVAELHNEAGDHAVNPQAVVKIPAYERQYVFDGLRSLRGIELHFERALVSDLEHDNRQSGFGAAGPTGALA